MKVLAIDTATSWQSIAILDNSSIVIRCDQEAGGSHSKLLLPTIDRLFAEAGISLRQLDGLVVSIGPGSFTGLRVGLATMLGFRAVTGLPLAAVPTLEGLAWNLRGASTPLCPVIMSRRGEVYWGMFRWASDNRVERIVPEQVGPITALAAALSEPTVVFGTGWDREGGTIDAGLSKAVKLIAPPEHASKPSAVSIGLTGIERLRRGETVGIGIAPFYVQRAEAELKYDESGGVSPVARRRARMTKKLVAQRSYIRTGKAARRARIRRSSA
jgi:tRNA threonylcarbamoyladenosine biosynthesis protein TsaB